MDYYLKLINFFKSHGINNDKMFNYIHKKIEFIDNNNKDIKDLRGIYLIYDKEKKLTQFELYLPDLKDEETILLSIRPYVQAIYAYNNLGKKYIANYESEMMAIHFEKTYLRENPNPKLEDYLNQIYSSIRKEQDDSKYKMALDIQEQLETKITNKNNKFKKIQSMAKKLTLKIKSK